MEKYTYVSGFKVGDPIKVLPGKRKYNWYITIDHNAIGRVVEPPNIQGWPDDAVQIFIEGGQGAVDADKLEKLCL